MRGRTLVLLALLLGLAACGGDDAPVSQTASSGQESGEMRGRHHVRASSLQRKSKPEIRVKDIPTLDMAALDRPPTSFLAGRDPFRYGEIPRPPMREPDRTPKVEKPQKPVQQTPTEPRKPQAPPFDYTFLGSFGSAGLRIGVFEDTLGNVVNAFEGEVLEGKFKILKIGYESVDIEFVGFPDTPAERKAIGG